MKVGAPIFAFTALALLVAMSVAAAPRAKHPGGRRRFGIAGTIAAILAVTLVVVAVTITLLHGWSLSLLMMKSPPSDLPARLSLIEKLSNVLLLAKPYLCLMFTAVVVWLVVQSRRHAGGSGAMPGEPPAPAAPPLSPPPTAFGQL